ncbi:MAG: NTP transferase domain-containing protein [Actinomycetota bacterium]|nr:NTP transferase domain-containing protein [Actinomycetota bacterium]
MSRIAGLLLAAGAGRRFGMPKALADSGGGPWVLTALQVLAGCDPRIVVVGADGDEVAALLPADVTVVRNPRHTSGMASSLRAGLSAVADDVDAVLVTLVDLPDVTRAVAARVLAAAGIEPHGALARAVFDGRPGHPVLIGRDHRAGVLASLTTPDAGAGSYLSGHAATAVECGDLADGGDQDTTE